MVKRFVEGKEIEVYLLCPYFKYTDLNNYTRFDYCVEASCAKWDAVNKQCCELTQAQALVQVVKLLSDKV